MYELSRDGNVLIETDSIYDLQEKVETLKFDELLSNLRTVYKPVFDEFKKLNSIPLGGIGSYYKYELGGETFEVSLGEYDIVDLVNLLNNSNWYYKTNSKELIKEVQNYFNDNNPSGDFWLSVDDFKILGCVTNQRGGDMVFINRDGTITIKECDSPE